VQFDKEWTGQDNMSRQRNLMTNKCVKDEEAAANPVVLTVFRRFEQKDFQLRMIY